jgi:hypothetical protein
MWCFLLLGFYHRGCGNFIKKRLGRGLFKSGCESFGIVRNLDFGMWVERSDDFRPKP